MKISYKLLITTCLVAGAITAHVMAADMKFEASLDRSQVAIGEAAQLGLSFYGTQSMPAPDIGNITGLEIRYIGPSTMMTVINGRVSSSITHMYTVMPLKVGKFQLGPFSFKYKGSTYTSSMVFLEVTEEKALPVRKVQPAAEADTAEKMNLEDRIFLVMKIGKGGAYVNELIPVTIKLYVNRLNVSDIQLPTFEQEGFSKVEFKEPKQFREEYGGTVYDVLEFKTSIFGTRPGDYKLGPARIKCNLMVKKRVSRGSMMQPDPFGDDQYRDPFFDDFFTRYEKHPLELRSQAAQLIISPLPTEGRPKDFTGAVGDYQFIYRANPTQVKIGDPITMNMEINGTGNFNTVLIPRLENVNGFKVYEAQIKTEENTKTFRQVLIPETDQVKAIPKAVFNYFDPNEKAYRTIAQGPIPIQVEKGKDEAPAQIVGPAPSAAEPTAKEEAPLARDIIYIKEGPGIWREVGRDFYRNKMFIISVFMPLLLLVLIYVVQERRDALKKDTVRASRIAAFRAARKGIKDLRNLLKQGDPKTFYEALFKTLQEYLGNRLRLPVQGITANIVERALTSRDIDLEILRKVNFLFDVCDRARFAYMQVDSFKMLDDLKELEEAVKYFEQKKI